MIHSSIAFDPASGAWRIALGEGAALQWSSPLTLQQLERALRAEHDRRLRDGQQTDFYANSISREVILAEGLLAGKPITHLDPTDPRLVRAKDRQEKLRLQNMSDEDFLNELGL